MDLGVDIQSKRKLDPERTRQDILAAAYDEFVAHGLNGARVDRIAARTKTAKRMIYYYYGSKEGLYLAVLEQAYAAIRAAEAGLELDRLPPEEAIGRMVEHTFDYHDAHPGFSRLVTIENIQQGRFMAQSPTIRDINVSVVETLRRILARGQSAGLFRTDIDPIDVHMMISALTFFRVANRHSFGILFGTDRPEATRRAQHRVLVVETVLRAIRAA